MTLTAPRQSAKLLVIMIITLALAALLWSHFFLNGSRFHPWTWHRAPVFPFIPLLVLAALPFAVAQALGDKLRCSARITIPLLMLSLFAMQVVSAMAQDHELSLKPIARQAESWLITSYLTDARALVESHVSAADILATYPDRVASFHLHSKSKPPAPLLYWYFFLRAFGSGTTTAILGGLVIGLLSTLSIPAVYWFTRTMTADDDAAFAAASYFALTPAAIVFLPQFDQVYPALACALLTSWILALRTGKLRWTFAFACTLTAITFIAYNLLVLGLFICACAALQIRDQGRPALRRFLASSAITLAVLTGFYLLLHLTTAYDPIATFRSVVHHQSQMKAELNRHWLATVPADFIDLALGAGWLALPLVIFYFLNRSPDRQHLRLALLAMLQIIVVAFSGLLPGETSRVWLFMLPLLLIPAALELGRWLGQHRWTVYLCLWLLTTMTSQNLRFH